MTAKLTGSKPQPIPGPRSSHAYQELVLSGEVIYNGALVAKDPSTGKWVEAVSTDSGQIVYGWARLGDIDNFNGTTAAALVPVPEMFVDSGCCLMVFGSITAADEGKLCYVVDDQTCTLTPGGPIAGVVQLFADSTHAYVSVDPLVNLALSKSGLLGASPAFKARLVVTSLSASYTGSKTATLTGPAATAWPTQDGITVANQADLDVYFIQEGTTNLADPADAGWWVITNRAAASGSWVLTRPSWYAHGAPIVPGHVGEIGPDGTGTNPTLAGTQWKSFAPKGKLIGADAPVYWPGSVSCGVTLASGTLAAARTTIPVRAALVTGFEISSNPATAPHANTRVWRVSALTPGLTGTASVQIVAESAPGTTNASDVGQYNIVATNW